MEYQITIGAWVIPTVLTVIAFIVANFATSKTSGYGGAIDGLFNFGLAVIFSLGVWLVYALLT